MKPSSIVVMSFLSVLQRRRQFELQRFADGQCRPALDWAKCPQMCKVMGPCQDEQIETVGPFTLTAIAVSRLWVTAHKGQELKQCLLENPSVISNNAARISNLYQAKKMLLAVF